MKSWALLALVTLPALTVAADDPFAEQFRSPDASYHLSGRLTGTQGVIDQGEYKSPDGRFALEVSYNDEDFAFALRDLKTGQSQMIQDIPTPVFTLDWSPGSNTLLLVGHYAQASEAVSSF